MSLMPASEIRQPFWQMGVSNQPVPLAGFG
jgi:hypothetical protein